MKRAAFISIGLIAALAIVLAMTRLLTPAEPPPGIPREGETGTLQGFNKGAQLERGAGVVQFALPYLVDRQLVRAVFLVMVTPATQVRVVGKREYLPASKYVGYLNKGHNESPQRDTSALRVVVRRKGRRLVAVRIEQMSVEDALKAAPKVQSLGSLDFSGSQEMTGVVRAWGDFGASPPGQPVTSDPRGSIDFTSRAVLNGYPVGVTTQAYVRNETNVTLDGKPVDMMDHSSDPFPAVMRNLVKVRLRRGTPLPDAVSVAGTTVRYDGPDPYETGIEDDRP